MGDVLRFTNAKWARLAPLWPQPHEVNCIVVHNFLGWEVPRFAPLSVFEHRWLDHLRGYRHREVHEHLASDCVRREREICIRLYGAYEIENVRHPPHACH